VTPEQFKHAKRLFSQAVELAEKERVGFLQRACSDDVEVRREVERLLAEVTDSRALDDLREKVFQVMDPGPDLSSDATATLQGGPLPPHETDDLREGSVIGRYRLQRPLGRGGFAQVWEAEDLDSGRRVALKVLKKRMSVSDEAVERFRREGKLAAQIASPSCVFVFGAGMTDARPFMAMEVMQGGTIQDRLDREKRFSVSDSVRCALDILDGLEAAHRAGILHRDLKPSNCFLDNSGRVKVGDFGISRTLEAGQDLTRTDSFIGTPLFASPEQLRGHDLDERTDFYSLGVTLYTLLAGRQPFEANNVSDLLGKILIEKPPSMRSLGLRVPRRLERIVTRLLDRDREHRYTDHERLRRDLAAFDFQTMEPAPLWRRTLAGVVDWGVLMAAKGAILLAVIEAYSISIAGLLDILLPFAATYFFITEFRLGASPGKLVFGLRVVGVGTQRQWRPFLLRSLLFAYFPNLFGDVMGTVALVQRWSVFDLWNLPRPVGLIAGYSPFVLLAVLFSSARLQNGFAAWHDRWSHTRVVQSGRRSMAMTAAPTSIELTPLEAPRSLGPYLVHGRLTATRHGQLLVGRDATLDRLVWIHEYTETTDAPAVDEIATPRSGWLRWLQRGFTGGRRWDAFEALPGAPLRHWIDSTGPQAWGVVREVVHALARAVQAPAGDQEDIQFGADRIWIGTDGRPHVLPFAVRPGDAREPEPDGDSISVLGAVMRRMLKGPDALVATGAPVQAVVPGHADPILSRLCGPSPTYASAKTVADDLGRCLKRRPHVTRMQRALTMAGPAGAMLFMTALFWMLFHLPVPDVVHAPHYVRILRHLEGEEHRATEASVKEATLMRKVMAQIWREIEQDRERIGWPEGVNSAEVGPGQFAEAMVGATSAEVGLGRIAATMRMYSFDNNPTAVRQQFREAGELYPVLTAEEETAARTWRSSHLSKHAQTVTPVLAMTIGLFGTALLSIVWVPMAGLLRGNLSFWTAGVRVRMADGLRPSRGRVFLRALLGASPLIVGCLIIALVGVSTAVAAATVLVLIVAIVHAFICPQASIADSIAGTVLVPS